MIFNKARRKEMNNPGGTLLRTPSEPMLFGLEGIRERLANRRRRLREKYGIGDATTDAENINTDFLAVYMLIRNAFDAVKNEK